jgi:hypothetical protein
MKKIGIVADNYKINKFKEELSEIGITELNVLPFSELTTLVTFNVPSEKIKDIEKLCKRLEIGFKNSN